MMELFDSPAEEVGWRHAISRAGALPESSATDYLRGFGAGRRCLGCTDESCEWMSCRIHAHRPARTTTTFPWRWLADRIVPDRVIHFRESCMVIDGKEITWPVTARPIQRRNH